MKIAYLILAHQNPQLLRRAIGTLSSSHAGFFIHIDGKADMQPFRGLTGDNVFISRERIPVYWGEFSIVRAVQLLIRQALERAEDYSYFVLLSGSDYPLRSGNYILKFMEANQGTEFMSLTQMPAAGYPLSKINRVAFPSSMPVRRFASRAMAKLGLAQRDFRKHLGELQPYGGSQWWALSRSACQFIMDFADRNPQLERYFLNTFTSDEMFFHTILGNSPFRARTQRNLVYLDWHTGGNHPSTLGPQHVEFFESRETVWVTDEWGSGEALFARKFSDDRLGLIDRIDQMIKRKERSAHGASPLAAGVL